MRIDNHTPNTIAWVDLAATDLASAIAFYTDYMGWTARNVPGTGYTVFLNGDDPVAGAFAIPPELLGLPQGWSVHVNVEDLDATCERVRSLSGLVLVDPYDAPGGGRSAVIADPSGAPLFLLEGGPEKGYAAYDEEGAPCWFDCFTRKPGETTEFFASLLGWDYEPMAPDYWAFSLNGRALAGVVGLGSAVPEEVPNHWRPTFAIGSPADEWVAAASTRRALVTQDLADTIYGQLFAIADPWGARLALVDRSTATA